jgi:hypothetical protein
MRMAVGGLLVVAALVAARQSSLGRDTVLTRNVSMPARLRWGRTGR